MRLREKEEGRKVRNARRIRRRRLRKALVYTDFPFTQLQSIVLDIEKLEHCSISVTKSNI